MANTKTWQAFLYSVCKHLEIPCSLSQISFGQSCTIPSWYLYRLVKHAWHVWHASCIACIAYIFKGMGKTKRTRVGYTERKATTLSECLFSTNSMLCWRVSTSSTKCARRTNVKMRSQENVQHVEGICYQVPITWLIPWANETKSSENPLKKYVEILFKNKTQLNSGDSGDAIQNLRKPCRISVWM